MEGKLLDGNQSEALAVREREKTTEKESAILVSHEVNLICRAVKND